MQKQQLELFVPKSENEKNTEAIYSNYIVYVDESGDHSPNISEHYPIFCLVFCIFHKKHYSQQVISDFELFKFKHFGHDQIVLHEHDIAKETKSFKVFFKNKSEKILFLEEISELINKNNFIIASCIVDKREIAKTNITDDLYHLALRQCLESLYDLMCEKKQNKLKTHVIVESRGRNEDSKLELAFRRICDGDNKDKEIYPFFIHMSDKKVMSTGLQIADLVARPIGRSWLMPKQQNRAFEILKEKFFCMGGRSTIGTNFQDFGMKTIPPTKSSRPQ